MPLATIASVDHEARGIARQDGKIIFVEGALPGEVVEFSSYRKKKNYELAHLVRVVKPSPQRVSPACPHFGVCGGCAMQHVDETTQVAIKQRILEDALWHVGRVRPQQIVSPVRGAAWGYRHRARLAVRLCPDRTTVLIGFHEKRSSYIADIQQCPVLPERVTRLFAPLRTLIAALSGAEHLNQMEVSLGEDVLALTFRIHTPLTVKDRALFAAFAGQHEVSIYLQSKGPESIRRLFPEDAPELAYTLPEFEVRLPFQPFEFTQVNHEVNRVMVGQALRLLDPQPGERIADWFCGLGNFSLPIARRGASVLAVEGSQALVARGKAAAAAHGLAARLQFAVANLFDITPNALSDWGAFDKWLIDPPRDGALALVRALRAPLPARIVYVSCNPATLARDAAVLVQELGYTFQSAGAINMFPQTAHVESIALFERSLP